MATTLSPLQAQLATRITATLANMGCSYTVTLPGGEVLTHGVVEQPAKTKRRERKFPYGEVRNYIRTYIGAMKAGDSVLIPYDNYGADIIQSGASSFLSHTAGPGTYVTAIRHDLKGVEVLFTGGL
jgi:hypothetical protein